MKIKYAFFLSLVISFKLTLGQFGFNRSDVVNVLNGGEVKKMPWAGGMDYCQYANIDLDFDGVEDLFVFDRTCNKVLTFLQKGATGVSDFEYAPEYESLFPTDLRDWALLVDYNCDGLKDIFTYRLGGAKVYLNKGNETEGHLFEVTVPILRTFIYGAEAYMSFLPIDVPSIVDVDGDGDIDVLTFGLPGTTVEYHKNMSMELYGTCDSLKYETRNVCWGLFKEDGATNVVSLWDTLTEPCRSEDLTEESPLTRPHEHFDRQDRHAGSSLLALDMDNSGVMDLIIGDISYNNLTLLMNSGEVVNANSGMESQDNSFPSTSTAVDIPVFPAAFHVDLNNDGKRDLMVSPASRVGSENVESNWSYLNTGEDLAPNFTFDKPNFLQGEMIDVGSSSLPVFFDHNGDGLNDLLVSALGQYNPAGASPISKISLYVNTGTSEAPVFTFVTDDYQGLSTKGIGSSLAFYPTFADLDGDGDEDMILGEYTGYCYFLENTGGAGNPAIFNTFLPLANSEGTAIFDGTFTYPNLVDLDRDGDHDLVIGKRNGKLSYYKNTGVGTYNFEFVTSEFGGVDVSGESIEGHAITQFVEVDGEYQLIVGTKSGYLYYYDDIEANLTGTFHLVDVSLDNINIGTYSAPAVANLNGNNRFEMVLGNRRGGVDFFESAAVSNIGLSNLEALKTINVFPNPATNKVNLDLGSLNSKQLEAVLVTVTDLTGKTLLSFQPQANQFQIDVSQFAKGAYIINLNASAYQVKEKLIIE